MTPTIPMRGKPRRQVLRAQRALNQAPDTRAIKRELLRRNPYMTALMATRGLYLMDGAIVQVRE